MLFYDCKSWLINLLVALIWCDFLSFYQQFGGFKKWMRLLERDVYYKQYASWQFAWIGLVGCYLKTYGLVYNSLQFRGKCSQNNQLENTLSPVARLYFENIICYSVVQTILSKSKILDLRNKNSGKVHQHYILTQSTYWSSEAFRTHTASASTIFTLYTCSWVLTWVQDGTQIDTYRRKQIPEWPLWLQTLQH